MEMDWRQRRTVTVLLAILAVLSAAVLVVLGIRYRASRPAEADAQTASGGAALPEEDPSALTYYNGSATLSFAKDETGTWIWTDEPSFPLDPAHIDTIMALLTDLRPQQTLAATEGPEAYGLEKPSATLEATLPDGSATALTLGKATTDGQSRYMIRDNDDTIVYIIDGALYQELCVPVYDMCVLPELPELTDNNLVSLTIQGPIPASPETGEEEEAPPPPAEPLITLLVAHRSGENPALWFHGNDNVSSHEQVVGILKDLRTLSLSKCIDYHPSDEAVSICGLDTPDAVLTVSYGNVGSEQTLTLIIGARLADGSGRYIRINGDDPVYLLLTEYLDPLMSVAASGLSNS